jgi:hypothetical protein
VLQGYLRDCLKRVTPHSESMSGVPWWVPEAKFGTLSSMFILNLSAVLCHPRKTGGTALGLFFLGSGLASGTAELLEDDNWEFDDSFTGRKHASPSRQVKILRSQGHEPRFLIVPFRNPIDRVLSLLLWRIGRAKELPKDTKPTLGLLWKQFVETEDLMAFLGSAAVGPDSLPVCFLSFKHLERDLKRLLRERGVLMGTPISLPHRNRNPRRSAYSSRYALLRMGGFFMLLATRHKRDLILWLRARLGGAQFRFPAADWAGRRH